MRSNIKKTFEGKEGTTSNYGNEAAEQSSLYGRDLEATISGQERERDTKNQGVCVVDCVMIICIG